MFNTSKSPVLQDNLLDALRAVRDPELGSDLVSLDMVRRAEMNGNTAHLAIELARPAHPQQGRIAADIEAAIGRGFPDASVEVEWSWKVRPGRHGGSAKSAEDIPALEGVKNIILVASGKGGVGKSTVATNLAAGLGRLGARVGLMDADTYGPSIPTMFDIHADVTTPDGKTINPHKVGDVVMMSMGFFIPSSKAMIWRGAMLHSAILQFARDVNWGELDYLVVDLPPGTGDVQLTLSQNIRVTGAVVVSTPQEVALTDVTRAASMFETVNIPVIGLVENMSYFLCDGCGKRHELFSHGGARKAAREGGMDFLAEIPIEPAVREAGDAGTPVVVAQPDSAVARTFMELASDIAGKVAVLNHKTPQAPKAEAGSSRLPVVG